MKKHKKNIIINILLSLVSIIITFLFIEMILRVSFVFHHYVYDESSWINPDNGVVISDNFKLRWESSGFNINKDKIFNYENEFPLEKENNTYRIAVLGDSITAGSHVGWKKSYPNLLSEKLKTSTEFKTEVINFGVLGYNVFQYEEQLKTKVLQTNPDMIIIGFYMNDFYYTPVILEDDGKTVLETNFFQNHPILDSRLFWKLYEKSYFVKFIYHKLTDIFIFSKYSDILNTHAILFELREKGYNSLKNIKKITENNKIKLVIVLFPNLNKKENYKEISVYKESIIFCKEQNITYIDILEIYDSNDPLSLRAEEKDVAHPNEKGHELISEELRKITVPFIKEKIYN